MEGLIQEPRMAKLWIQRPPPLISLVYTWGNQGPKRSQNLFKAIVEADPELNLEAIKNLPLALRTKKLA